MKNKNNFTSKPITAFDENDTLYMQKNNNGFGYTFLLKFKSFTRGIVLGEVLEIQPNNIKSLWLGKEFVTIGGKLSGSVSKCYTFKSDLTSRAIWFKKENGIWACYNKNK